MNFVVDASAAFIALTDVRADTMLRDADRLFAPDLIVPELLNIRWKVGRGGSPTPPIATTMDFIGRVAILPSVEYAVDADDLARAIDHPVYDCLYAAVARRFDATLVTADARFARKIPMVRTSVIVPS